MGSRISFFLNQLREAGESELLEAKTYKDKIGDKSLLESISAFSNTNGGVILIGIGPHPDYQIVGVNDFDKIESEISTLCANEFNNRPSISIEKEVIDDLKVILLEIRQSEQPLCIKSRSYDKAFFTRICNTNITATQEDISRLFLSKNKFDYELSIAPDSSINDIDDEIIDMYRDLRSKVDDKASEIRLKKTEFLKAINCTTNGKVNMLGILCFGTEHAFSRHFTTCSIDYIISDANQWIVDPERRYDRKLTTRKSIILQRMEIHELLEKNITKIFHHTQDNIESNELSVIPKHAIDEAITNAIMHRDYSVNTSIQILQFGNRIEFNNPGYSLKSLDLIKESGSYPRNPKLCSIFEKIRYCETVGSGIKTMMEAMRRNNLDEPVIDSNRTNNTYAITFLYKHLLDDKIQDHMNSFIKKHSLTNTDIAALAYIYKTGSINNEIFRQINNVDIYTASESLKKLVKKGLISNKGTSKRVSVYEPTRYFLEAK